MKKLLGVDLTSFFDAVKSFELFRGNLGTDQEKAGAIQAFEYSFELSWKTMKRLLAVKGLNASSPRDVIRLAATDGMIKDPVIWFDFIEIRNLASHTYNKEITDKVLRIFQSFSHETSELIQHFENEISKNSNL